MVLDLMGITSLYFSVQPGSSRIITSTVDQSHEFNGDLIGFLSKYFLL
ncbi:hypothetical protein [Methanobacterium petrolearium]|nr:hypothetical protein [Methanobacterium petrolearium]